MLPHIKKLLQHSIFHSCISCSSPAIILNHNVSAIAYAQFLMLWNLFSGFVIPHKVGLSIPAKVFVSNSPLFITYYLNNKIVTWMIP